MTYYKATLKPNDYDAEPGDRVAVDEPSEANLIGSLNADGTHSILLDLDGPHLYSNSSTIWHGHLTLYTKTSWRRYRRVLKALYKAGAIERGFYVCTKKRRQGFLRTPWTVKDHPQALANAVKSSR